MKGFWSREGANFAFSYLKPTRPYHSAWHYRAASDVTQADTFA